LDVVLALVLALGLAHALRAGEPSGTPGVTPGAAPAIETDAPVILREGFAIEGVVRGGRVPIPIDHVASALARGTLAAPGDGVTLLLPNDRHAEWRSVRADDQGRFPVIRGGYLALSVSSPGERVAMLRATGHAMVFVNSEPRAGDPYAHGYVDLPILLRAGENLLLFASAGRGPIRAELRPPPTPPGDVFALPEDLTVPDVIIGESEPLEVGVVVVNASDRPRHVAVRQIPPGSPPRSAPPAAHAHEPALPPLSVRKMRLTLTWPDAGAPPTGHDGPQSIRFDAAVIERIDGDERPVHSFVVELRLRQPHQTHRRTFISAIDGSVQYYAVVPPPTDSPAPDARPGLVLSLHGASVEAISQAQAYSSRPGVYIVCPTNRRPFGFDWESWGRLDALEVLSLAERRFRTDPARRYLTGHSMGGHGTWHLGVMHPELWAAIAPSAGWLSFDTYTGARLPPQNDPGDEAIAEVFRRASADSDIPARMHALRDHRVPVYILHGDKDDNVPVTQARRARELLRELGLEPGYHEQPDAGHWWDGDAAPGADCVDWPPIFEVFDQSRRNNAAPMPASLVDPAPPALRPFMVRAFVYATSGTAEENAWSLARACFDAERWWYQGNGRGVVLSDHEALNAGLAGVAGVLAYGHSDMNLWVRSALASGTSTPVRIARGRAEVEGRMFTHAVHEQHRDNGFGLILRLDTAPVTPAQSHRAELDVSTDSLIIAGTTLQAMRATDRWPLFSSGVRFPGVTVFRSDAGSLGIRGIVGAGWLSSDARVPEPERVIQWRSEAGGTAPSDINTAR
jgi:dienelactone hydrolase